ncbi:hypothetical protein [Aeromonas jandaei]|uniref:hypothetical protein n=1 Tax=Aeromonas jandaei TaxID=650 RepID=UPI003671F4C9
MNKKINVIMLFIISLNSVPVMADTLRILEVKNPELIEVEAAVGGEYRLLSELGKLNYPLQAKAVKAERLEFTQDGKAWLVSRADVQLANEKLVVDACDTVPVTLPNDAKSASVKGAGERCE